MSKSRNLALAILSAVLLTFSWPVIGSSWLIFIAWIPLLLLAEQATRNDDIQLGVKPLFLLSHLTFFIWNVGTTWWIVNASGVGAALAFIANSFLMALVFVAVVQVRKKNPRLNTPWLLVPFWLAGEYLHHDWDLSWPWLTLGNAFADNIQIIQWYEYTGSSGGSAWILCVNILLLTLYKKFTAQKSIKPTIRAISMVMLVPIMVSLTLFLTWKAKGETTSVSLVQPNIDPYGFKFDFSTLDDQLESFLKLAGMVTDSSTQWLIGPETALVRSIGEDEFEESKRIQKLRVLEQQYPKLNILIGAETHKIYYPGQTVSATARKDASGIHYDVFNTAVLLNDPAIFYHKSKLVPGVEQMPFPWFFSLFEDFAIELGGTSGTLGKQDERTVMPSRDRKTIAAPAICYESVFGDFLTQYVRKGACFIAVITNDGWWGDTPGYKQHLAYAKLRAIENRRDVVRSANTGISCFINQRGEITRQLPYWKQGAIKQNIYCNTELTLFSRTGDLLGKTSVFLLVFMLVWITSYSVLKTLKMKNTKKTQSTSHS
jgi:apolipoprotein N-acyltransferase